MKDFSLENWMQNSLPFLGDRRLNQICIPGSHDSGMCEMHGKTAFATEANVITQKLNIGQQLRLGIRHFDIRPSIGRDGKLRTGHYGNVPAIGYQGAGGQSIDSIVDQIIEFLNGKKELVFIDLSHPLNVESKVYEGRDFTQKEWERTLDLFMKIPYLYRCPFADTKSDLLSSSLNHYIKNGPSVILYVEDRRVNFERYWGETTSVFYDYRCKFYSSYADSNSIRSVALDQIKKMRWQTGREPFYLSWTMTQQGVQTIGGETILSMARRINQEFWRFMTHISPYNFPNVISIDCVEDGRAAQAAMEINETLIRMGAADDGRGRYIEDICFVYGDTAEKARGYLPLHYDIITQDLNQGAKGNYIYLCVKHTENVKRAIRSIYLEATSSAPDLHSVPAKHDNETAQYDAVEADLNKGAGGDYIHLWFTRRSSAPPITELRVKSFDRAQDGPSYVKWKSTNKSADCNKGAEGKYIYIELVREKV